MHVRPVLLAPILALILGACAHKPVQPIASATAPTLQGDPAHPGATKGWVNTQLYFGLGPIEHPDQGLTEVDWRAFLDKEVTPRFPDGLSVMDVYGQWEGKNQSTPERLRSKMLIVDYPDTAEEPGENRGDSFGLETEDGRPVRDAGNRIR